MATVNMMEKNGFSTQGQLSEAEGHQGKGKYALKTFARIPWSTGQQVSVVGIQPPPFAQHGLLKPSGRCPLYFV